HPSRAISRCCHVDPPRSGGRRTVSSGPVLGPEAALAFQDSDKPNRVHHRHDVYAGFDRPDWSWRTRSISTLVERKRNLLRAHLHRDVRGSYFWPRGRGRPSPPVVEGRGRLGAFDDPSVASSFGVADRSVLEPFHFRHKDRRSCSDGQPRRSRDLFFVRAKTQSERARAGGLARPSLKISLRLISILALQS